MLKQLMDMFRTMPKSVMFLVVITIATALSPSFFSDVIATIVLFPLTAFLTATSIDTWIIPGSEYFFDNIIRVGLLSGFIGYYVLPKQGKKFTLYIPVVSSLVGLSYWDTILTHFSRTIYQPPIEQLGVIFALFTLPPLVVIGLMWVGSSMMNEAYSCEIKRNKLFHTAVWTIFWLIIWSHITCIRYLYAIIYIPFYGWPYFLVLALIWFVMKFLKDVEVKEPQKWEN